MATNITTLKEGKGIANAKIVAQRLFEAQESIVDVETESADTSRYVGLYGIARQRVTRGHRCICAMQTLGANRTILTLIHG